MEPSPPRFTIPEQIIRLFQLVTIWMKNNQLRHLWISFALDADQVRLSQHNSISFCLNNRPAHSNRSLVHLKVRLKPSESFFVSRCFVCSTQCMSHRNTPPELIRWMVWASSDPPIKIFLGFLMARILHLRGPVQLSPFDHEGSPLTNLTDYLPHWLQCMCF